MRKFKFSYLLVMQIIFYLFLFRSVLAQTTSLWGDIDPIKIVFGPDVPEEWYDMYLFMQWLVFPFIGIWMVLYGILEELRIFRRRASIQGILALVIALIASSSGGLVILSRGIFMALGGWGLIVFFVVFFLGAGLWGWGTLGMGYRSATLYQQYDRDLKQISNDVKTLKKQQADAVSRGDSRMVESLAHAIRMKEARRKEIQDAYGAAEK